MRSIVTAQEPPLVFGVPRSPVEHLRALRRGMVFLAILSAAVALFACIGWRAADASAAGVSAGDLCAGYALPCAP